jgi:glycosyltransferase involved in cell wall biosynthesis
MHVAVDANALAWGWSGVPKYIDRLVRELASQGLALTLLANTEDADLIDIPGVRTVVARRRGGARWRDGFVTPWLSATRPDVYWAPEGALPHRCAVPSVITIHDLTPISAPETKDWRARLSFRAVVRSAVAADRVIAVSEWTAREVERLIGVDPSRIRVIPNGVDAAFIPGDRSAAGRSVERRWGITPPIVLAVGTLERRKGLDVVVDATGAVAGGTDGWNLVIAGSEADRVIAAKVDATPRCHRIGPVSDQELVDLYHAADVLVAPALTEGFGITPLEAMASGTPAVVSSDSGALEIISGEAAVVVGERSPAAWIAAIQEARASRSQLVERGVACAARYRWDRAACEVRAVFDELVA